MRRTSEALLSNELRPSIRSVGNVFDFGLRLRLWPPLRFCFLLYFVVPFARFCSRFHPFGTKLALCSKLKISQVLNMVKEQKGVHLESDAHNKLDRPGPHKKHRVGDDPELTANVGAGVGLADNNPQPTSEADADGQCKHGGARPLEASTAEASTAKASTANESDAVVEAFADDEAEEEEDDDDKEEEDDDDDEESEWENDSSSDSEEGDETDSSDSDLEHYASDRDYPSTGSGSPSSGGDESAELSFSEESDEDLESDINDD
ncbi:unnamed protein product [Calypogeia fissa]